MAITSLGFLIFLALTITIFYLVPNKFKWIVILAVSLIFIASYDFRGILFLALTALIIWLTGIKLEKISDIETDKNIKKKKKKTILILALVFILGILALIKYIFPMAVKISDSLGAMKIFIPLGLSYYTLQAISYVLDVYWGRIKAEKSYFRIFTFISFFPQMLQGPINRYKELSHELFQKDHSFNIKNVKYGVQLMLWGYFKILVVSERAAFFVKNAFFSGETAYGLAAFIGLALFGIQLYGNFSGGIDVVRGAALCLDVELPDNFRQPFFSKSLGEFWRRWHITLGAWMKDYIFYPFSMSKPVSKFKKSAKKHMSRKWANRIPIAFANLLVFTIVGIWHGFGTNYLLWGLYNGIILAFNELMVDVYKTSKENLHINSNCKLWNIFTIIRTFVVVTIGWCTDCSNTALGSLFIVKNMFMIHMTNLNVLGFGKLSTTILLLTVTILFIVSILHERKIHICDKLDNKDTFLQMILWIVVIQSIVLFRISSSLGGFIYADF